MAEAAVQSPTSSNSPKYFCHKCSVSVDLSPELPDLTCPRCESGFIEEMTKDLQEQHAARAESSPQMLFRGPEMPNFISNLLFTTHDDCDRTSNHDDDDDSDDEDEEEYARLPLRYSHDRRSHLLRRRTRGRSPLSPPSSEPPRSALPRFLEDLMRELSGGGSSRMPSLLPLVPPLFHGDPRDYAWGADGLDNAITQLLNQWECPGAPPASKDDIERLVVVAITQEHIDNELQCSVCMEDFSLSETVLSLPCQHLFHNDCINPWLELHNTCPICRQTLGEDAIASDEVATAVAVPSLSVPRTASSRSSSSSDSMSSSDERLSAAVGGDDDITGCGSSVAFERNNVAAVAADEHTSDGEEKKDIDKPTTEDDDHHRYAEAGKSLYGSGGRHFDRRTAARNLRPHQGQAKNLSYRLHSSSTSSSSSCSSTDDCDTA